MWSRRDNQEVGLEAATLERVRNSSLSSDPRDNVRGSSVTAEVRVIPACTPRGLGMGRGASVRVKPRGSSGDGSRVRMQA